MDDWVKENNITIDIIGIENLSEINGVVVSNHYCIFDWYFIGRALKEKTEKDTYTITAEFNYRRNPIGDLILSERCWPICNYRHFGQTDEEKQKIKKNLKDAISTRLEKGDNVLVLTSGTMWNMYTKPQPSKRGAFFWVIENDKPVLPVFATNKPNGEQDEMKPELNKNIKIHFGAPIYHDPDLIPEENVTDMIRSVFKWQQSIYEHEYGFKLEYGCALKWNDYVKSGASATAIQEFIGNHKTV